MKRLNLLMLSAGSALGQNFLDALEGRRDRVRAVGIDAAAANPRLFRYDAAYLCPSTDDALAFRARLREIIAAEQPDLVFAGRDHDVPFLGELHDSEPALRPRLTCGPARIAALPRDKWESFLFARSHNLPFADTIQTGPATDMAAARAFLARHGVPLIAKPRHGWGTLGVRILLDEAQFERAIRRDNYLIQPFLAPPPGLREKFFDPADGWPYFHHLADERHFAAELVFGPDSKLAAEPFCSCITLELGRPIRSQPWPEPAFLAVAHRYAAVLGHEGWRGPFTLQCRRLDDGSFVCFELAARISGTTSARRWFGFDEIGLMTRAFAGVELPMGLPPGSPTGPGFVAKSLSENFAPDAWVRELAAHGAWHRPAPE